MKILTNDYRSWALFARQLAKKHPTRYKWYMDWAHDEEARYLAEIEQRLSRYKNSIMGKAKKENPELFEKLKAMA